MAKTKTPHNAEKETSAKEQDTAVKAGKTPHNAAKAAVSARETIKNRS